MPGTPNPNFAVKLFKQCSAQRETERERERRRRTEKKKKKKKKPLSSVSLKLRASEWLIGHTVQGIDVIFRHV